MQGGVSMSRQERIDSTCAVLFAAILLILLGASIPQPSAAPAPLPATVAASSVTEDAESTATDSESDPSGIAGMTMGELLRDAWQTYKSLPESAPSGAYTAVPEYAASYDGTPATFPADYFTLESINQPGVFHVFHMVAAQRA
jgi:hypothetical protein